MSLNELFSYSFLGNPVGNYFIALVVFILVSLALKIFEAIFISRFRKVVTHTATKLDDVLVKILASVGWPFYVILGLWAAFRFIVLPAEIQKYFSYLTMLVLVYYVALGGQIVLVFFVDRLKRWDRMDEGAAGLLGKFGKVILWLVAALLILQNFGFNISALLAGFGIGGIALAFALQNVLTDIFAYFSIHLDKPFKIGDFIIIDQDMGTVDRIGIKSTRIHTLSGEELVISNKELTERRVHNYKLMQERRIQFDFGVTYDTSLQAAKNIPQIIRDIFQKVEITRLDRVNFKNFGDFSLVFEVVYFVLTGDYNKYMDIQEQINLAMKESFEKEGIEFAYPTQTILLNK